jgi:HEAT repeat protein
MPLHDILAVRALVAGSVDYTTLVDAFLAGLDHPNARLRYDCAHALDHFADDRCVPGLWRLLSDPAPRVRRMALHVLSCEACKLAPLPAEDDLTPLIIERAMADPSINVRRHAALALGVYGRDSRAGDTLASLIARESDPALLRHARWALRQREARLL